MSQVLDQSSEGPLNEGPPVVGMTTKVVKGSIWSLIGQMLPMLAAFIATPFTIGFLGAEAYGVLLLIGLIPTYFSFADFGMGLASTKFASEAFASGSRQKEASIVLTATLIAFLTSLLFAVPIFIFSHQIMIVFGVPEALRHQAGVALRIASISFIFGILNGVLNTPQLTRLRMDLNSVIGAVPKILMAFMTPLILYVGGYIIEAIWVGFFGALLILAGHIFFSSRLLPEIFTAGIDTTLIRPLSDFGRGVVTYGIGLIMVSNLDKLLLTYLVSVKYLAYYSVAFTLASMSTALSYAMIQSLIPAFSQLISPEKRQELDALFSRSLRLSIIALLPSILVLFVIAKPFFTMWAGKDFGSESVYPFYILLGGVFFAITVFVPNCLLIAHGRPDIIGKVQWIEMLPYGLLAYVLISGYGIIGAALAWSIRELINACAYMILTKKITGVDLHLRDRFRDVTQCLLAILPLLVCTLLFDFSLWLIALLFAYLCLYSVFVWKRMMKVEERVWAMNLLEARTGRKFLRV